MEQDGTLEGGNGTTEGEIGVSGDGTVTDDTPPREALQPSSDSLQSSLSEDTQSKDTPLPTQDTPEDNGRPDTTRPASGWVVSERHEREDCQLRMSELEPGDMSC